MQKRGFQVRLIFFLCIIYSNLIFSNLALASGGGPLLLLFNLSVFIVGQIWIIGIEYLIYLRMIKSKEVSREDLFWDVVSVNLYSTILVAFGVPFLIAIIGMAGSFMPGELGAIWTALSTWVYDKARYGKLSVYVSLIWFLILFFLTVQFEAWVIKKRWIKRDFKALVSILKLCWVGNTISHLGLLIAILIIWREVL